MGRKLAPLRKLFAQTGKDSSNPPDRSQLGKRLPAVATGIGSGTNDRPSRTKKNKSEENDDGVDWEKIEAEQQNAEGGDSDSEEDDDSDEEGGIRLDGSLEHEVEDYTFEFNDMRDEYSEGICTMLRKFIANPTDAYSLATVVTSQTIVGTVVNCEDGQDSFAFATVLPFHKLEKVASMKAITEHLATGLDKLLHGASNEEVQLLRDCLSVPAASSTDKPAVSGTKSPKGASVHASRTGLLLHKRFTNLPLQLVGALHRNLEEDVSWAQQQATDDDEMAQEDYISSSNSSSSSTKNKATKGTNFFAEARNVILLCECEVSKDGKSAFAFPEPSSCYSVLGSCSDIVFSCFEDEVYLQHATAAVLFRPPKSLCGTELVALLVPISKLQKCATGICDLLPA